MSLGNLATSLGISKSGVFAHFTSKEELLVEVLQLAAVRFDAMVLRPAFTRPRGVPRLKAIFNNWIRWINDPASPGGCLFLAASTELDDREGPPRDFLVASQRLLQSNLAKAVSISIGEGQFRKDVDAELFAFELQSILMGYHYQSRLLRDPKAEKRARAAFDRLLDSAAASN
jgi:AcrR family transcriptional regulator